MTSLGFWIGLVLTDALGALIVVEQGHGFWGGLAGALLGTFIWGTYALTRKDWR